MSNFPRHTSHGPFQSSDLDENDRYELSDGDPLYCVPAGGRHGEASGLGFSALRWDPEVDAAGIDVGYSPRSDLLRAPDVAVGNVPSEPGWVAGAPPLAVEYADTGQDEDELQAKIHELLGAGTQYLWVVRLSGVRRVEVYERDQPPRTVGAGEVLTAPGVLKNPIPIEALYDERAAREVVLRNLLERAGYESLEAVREEGVEQGQLREARAILAELVAQRGFLLDDAQRRQIDACDDLGTLRRFLRNVLMAKTVDDVFA